MIEKTFDTVRFCLILLLATLLVFQTEAQNILTTGSPDQDLFIDHYDQSADNSQNIQVLLSPGQSVTEWRMCLGTPCPFGSPTPFSEGVRHDIPNTDGTNDISITFSGNIAFVELPMGAVGVYHFRLGVQLSNTTEWEKPYTLVVRQPLRLAFVIDRSGSMECGPGRPATDGTGWDACTMDTLDKWAMAQDAMLTFGSQMNSTNESFLTGDRLGIIYFDGAIGTSIISTAGNGFRPRNVFTAANINNDFNGQYVGGILGRNGTNLGLGLQTAVYGADFFNGDLTQPHRQVIVLLTDGVQNRAPLVEPSGKRLADGTDLLNTQTAADFIQVYSMEFDNSNPGSMAVLLGNIATAPQNYFNVMLSPAGDNIYTPAFNEIFNRVFNQSTPQLINREFQSYALQEDTISQSFTVNGGGTKLYFQASFNREQAGRFDYFVSKDGQLYSDSVDVLTGQFSAMVTVDVMADTTLDSRGEWTLHCVRKPVIVYSQPIPGTGTTINGSVRDLTGEPLIGANVLLQGTAQGTTTDIDGNFSFNDLPAGPYTLVVSYVGFNTQEHPIGLSLGQTATATIVLVDPSAPPLRVALSASTNEHRLKTEFSIDQDPTIDHFGGVQVGARLSPKVRLQLNGLPVTDALVTAELIRPGDDRGDLVARANVDPAPLDSSEVTNLFTAKYQAIAAQDPDYLAGLALQANTIVLEHQGNGLYEGRFDKLEVTANCAVILRVATEDPSLGSIRRYERISTAVRFGELEHDLAEQSSSVDETAGGYVHTLTYTPAYRVGNTVRLVGPGWENAFAAQNAELLDVSDGGDGSYVLQVKTPELNTKPRLTLQEEPFYEDRSLTDFGKPYSPFNWNVSLHGGVTLPFNQDHPLQLGSNLSEGIYLEADLGYQVLPRWGLELIGGYYGFKTDYYVAGGGLHLRYAVQEFGEGNLNRLLVAAGGGLYQPKSGDLQAGFGGRLTYERSLTQRLFLGGELAWYQLLDLDLSFGLAGFSLKYQF